MKYNIYMKAKNDLIFELIKRMIINKLRKNAFLKYILILRKNYE